MAEAAWSDTIVSPAPDADWEALFSAGVWAQHLQDQNNRAAAVQGVRFFFHDATLPAQPANPEDLEWEVLRGARGYICALAQTATVDANGSVRLGLESVKSVLLAGKAWEANRKAFLALCGRVVPVIYMTTGRPKDRRFGSADGLLGLCTMEDVDATSLSCLLVPAASPTGQLSAEATREQIRERVGVGARAAKRRRREIPIFSCAGAQMGPLPHAGVALTGAHCRDLWVESIQKASVSIDVNAYCISDLDVLEELRKAAARQVLVRVRYDNRQQLRTLAGCFEEERYRQLQVHPVHVSEDERAIMHKKELLVDGSAGFAVIGSYNPTANARTNQESAIVQTDAATVRLLSERFELDWQKEECNHSRDTSTRSSR